MPQTAETQGDVYGDRRRTLGQYLPLMIWSSIARNNRVLVPLPPRGSGHAFVEFLKARMEAGQFRAVIDRRYSLDEIADAYCYVETGQKVGIVVINVAAADERAHIAQDSRIGTGPSTSIIHL